MSRFLRPLCATLLLTALATTASAQSATITANATVLQPLTVSNVRNLDFANVYPGVSKTIAYDATTSGKFSVTGFASAQVNVSFTLPTNLSSGANTLPIGTWTGCHNTADATAGCTTFTPSSSTSTTSLAAVTVLALVDRRTGARRPVTTFGDGEFTAIAVRPASYDITVDERLLAELGASAEPARFVLAADPDGALIQRHRGDLRRSATSHVATDARASVSPPDAPAVTRATPLPAAPSSDPPAPAQSGRPAPVRREAVATPPPAVGQLPLPTIRYHRVHRATA